jgi:hypothetical protein|tara:strand:- start:219 stop:689 length:471 start_codon:yes stop_codon:yes gene_type:complete
MINNIAPHLTNENIYLFANWGVLPFWLLLIFAPNSTFSKVFVHSIIAPLFLSIAYIFVSYKIYIEGNIFEGFNLYYGLENLYSVYSDESFLLIFWLHFLSISLFIGAWIARDAKRFMMPNILTIFCLIMTYFMGPIGLLIYWFIRIFFAKKISFND